MINSRFKVIVEDYIKETLGINKKDLASLLELKPSLFSEILNGRTSLSLETTARFIMLYPQVNIIWLLTGEGEMLHEENIRMLKTDPQETSEEIMQLNKKFDSFHEDYKKLKDHLMMWELNQNLVLNLIINNLDIKSKNKGAKKEKDSLEKPNPN